MDADEDALQRAIAESLLESKSEGLRPLMGQGPFLPAGLQNSGNSCFWNALLQALFFATPVFRGALFQLDGHASEVLSKLRDLFAEMDMGLRSAIDAGRLYRMIFQRPEEADVSEQMLHLFEIASEGPRPLQAVWRELFGGELLEQLKGGGERRVELLSALDLTVTRPLSLPELLEEHAVDVQGSVVRRCYRLPPVLWLNLSRFAYDRASQCGRKRQVRLSFPERLNCWMLAPLEKSWAKGLKGCVERREELLQELAENRKSLEQAATASETEEQEMLLLAEQQEALLLRLKELEEELERLAAEQELVYDLRAVIVHQGHVDSGHYFTYADTLKGWCCLNDSSVSPCEEREMRRVAEGSTLDDEAPEDEAPELPEAPSRPEAAGRGEEPETWWRWLSGCVPATRSMSEELIQPQEHKPIGSPVLEKAQPVPRSSAEARCLVYVRCGGGEKLLDEVRQRIPAALQEEIDVANLSVLRSAVGRVAEALVAAQRGELVEIQGTADWVREEKGLSMARAYLLRACWRLHVPWLPEELCPTAEPPDFRMYYGQKARQLLLDELIRRGLHDLASLAASGEEDAFVPREMQEWLTDRGL